MVRIFRQYLFEEWSAISDWYTVEKLDSSKPLYIDALPSDSVNNLLERSSTEYPKYLFNGSAYLSSTPFLHHCSEILTVPNSYQFYTLNGVELPLNYSSYEEYICSNSLVGWP